MLDVSRDVGGVLDAFSSLLTFLYTYHANRSQRQVKKEQKETVQIVGVRPLYDMIVLLYPTEKHGGYETERTKGEIQPGSVPEENGQDMWEIPGFALKPIHTANHPVAHALKERRALLLLRGCPSKRHR